MDDKQFDRIEKQIELLARTMVREFRDLHHSVNYRFGRVNARPETIDGKIEAFSRRVDDEAERATP
jgi:hypothetical protein